MIKERKQISLGFNLVRDDSYGMRNKSLMVTSKSRPGVKVRRKELLPRQSASQFTKNEVHNPRRLGVHDLVGESLDASILGMDVCRRSQLRRCMTGPSRDRAHD